MVTTKRTSTAKAMGLFLTFLIVLTVIFILNHTVACAASPADLTYTYNTKTKGYTVSDCRTSASGYLVIPATYNGLPITTVGNYAFQDCSNLTSVTIPDTITTVGDYAFASCSNLRYLTIGNGVTTIGKYAFASCSNLTEVTLGNSIAAIGDHAFSFCYKLRYNTYENCGYLGNTANPYLVLMAATSSSVTSVRVHDTTKHIAEQALFACSNLTSVNIPNSVITIGSSAFSFCENLTEVTIGNGVTTIGDGAFKYCPSMTVYYSGTKALWDAVSIGNNNDSLINAVIHFRPLLTIVTQPSNIVACHGNNIAFTVEAMGDELAYQWQTSVNGNDWNDLSADIIGYNAATLCLVVDYAQNNFLFRCRISDCYGDERYTVPVILVVEKPALGISVQPTDAIVQQGRNAEFSIEAIGDGIAYCWQYKKADGTSWHNSSSATAGYNTNKLTVVGTSARNGFFYRCKVTDQDGKGIYTNAVKLTVEPATLVFTKQPQNNTVKQGNKASFTVAAEGEGLTYQWQYSTNGGGYWANSSSYTTGYNSPSLTVIAEAKRNGFLYRCRITDAYGNKFYSQMATLHVEVPVSAFAAQPKAQFVMENNQAVFNITTQGSITSIQWQYQTAPGKAWYNSSSATQGYNTDTLVVKAEAKRNGFAYRCIVTDTDGYIHTSNAAKLTITKAQFTYHPTAQTAKAGSKTVFFVIPVGEYTQVYWQYSKDGGKSWYASSSSFPGYNSTTMTVEATAARNGFMYRCVVIDADGNRIVSDAATLTVQ